MKNLIKILLVVLVLCTVVSCKTCQGYVDPEYSLKNESGHAVSVVFRNGQNTDSLVLLHGEEKSVSSSITEWVNVEDNKIYYDDRYVVKFSELIGDRRVGEYLSYTPILLNNKSYYYLFTFIDDDYRFAVENGVDLEAEK